MTQSELVDHEASEHFAATGHMPVVFGDYNGNLISWACMTCDCNPELDLI